MTYEENIINEPILREEKCELSDSVKSANHAVRHRRRRSISTDEAINQELIRAHTMDLMQYFLKTIPEKYYLNQYRDELVRCLVKDHLFNPEESMMSRIHMMRVNGVRTCSKEFIRDLLDYFLDSELIELWGRYPLTNACNMSQCGQKYSESKSSDRLREEELLAEKAKKLVEFFQWRESSRR